MGGGGRRRAAWVEGGRVRRGVRRAQSGPRPGRIPRRSRGSARRARSHPTGRSACGVPASAAPRPGGGRAPPSARARAHQHARVAEFDLRPRLELLLPQVVEALRGDLGGRHGAQWERARPRSGRNALAPCDLGGWAVRGLENTAIGLCHCKLGSRKSETDRPAASAPRDRPLPFLSFRQEGALWALGILPFPSSALASTRRGTARACSVPATQRRGRGPPPACSCGMDP
jgi:hypothetical protein